jgi:hypothetical protein
MNLSDNFCYINGRALKIGEEGTLSGGDTLSLSTRCVLKVVIG